MTEMPPRPQLERRQRLGQNGEVIDELTPESELRWAEYLRELHLAKLAVRSAGESNIQN